MRCRCGPATVTGIRTRASQSHWRNAGKASDAARSQETTSLAPLLQTSGEVLVAFEASFADALTVQGILFTENAFFVESPFSLRSFSSDRFGVSERISSGKA